MSDKLSSFIEDLPEYELNLIRSKERHRVIILSTVDKEKFLLLRRSSKNKSNVGHWESPGGKPDIVMDKNSGKKRLETLKETIERETKEETGLELEINNINQKHSFKATDGRTVNTVIALPVNTGSIKLSDEHDDLVWVTKTQALQMENLKEETREAIEALL